MMHTYIPNTISVCKSYLFRYPDITTKQLPLLLPNSSILTQIIYSSKAIEPGQYAINIEANNMLITTIQLTNGEIGQAILPTNIVLPNATGVSLQYAKVSGLIADLQITLLYKELC